ncbi:MAG: Lrp/AsnC ligand binding domain-containing protein [Candidatus Odinarchaeia archaeon]
MLLDDIDQKIIECLMKNSRASYSEIASSLKKNNIELSEGAVRKRVKRLVNKGIIEQFTIQLGGGLGVKAVILVRLSPQKQAVDVSKEIMKIKGVEKIYEVAGPYDSLVIVNFAEVSSLNNCIDSIRAIEGVASTTTFLVLKERKVMIES